MTFLSSNTRLPTYRWKDDVPGELFDALRVATTHADVKMFLGDPAPALFGNALLFGAAAVLSSPNGFGEVTVTGLVGVSANDVGRYLTLVGGVSVLAYERFYILSFVGVGSVKIYGPSLVADLGPLSWKITVDGWDLNVGDRVARIVPELQSGSVASVAAFSAGEATLVGLRGMTPSHVGKQMILSNGVFPLNRGTFNVTVYLNPGSVKVANPVAVVDPSSLTWNIRNRGRLVDNGIYDVTAGAWTRSVDANTGALIKDAVVEAEFSYQGAPKVLAQGNTATVSSIVPLTSITFSGLTGMTTDLVGQTLVVSGAAQAGNNGSFVILTVNSLSSVTCTAAAAVFPDANSTKISWRVIQVGSTAAIVSVTLGIATISGLNGMEPSSVGNWLNLSGAVNPRNNGTFRITNWISATQVEIAAQFGVGGGTATSWEEILNRNVSFRTALYAPLGIPLVVNVDPQQWLVLIPYYQSSVSVTAATNVNVPVRSGFLQIDGRNINDGEVVLLLGQSVVLENGLYTVRAGQWESYTPTGDASYATPLSQYWVAGISCGSEFQATTWILSSPTNAPIVPGVDVQTWFSADAPDTDLPGPIRVDANFGDSFQVMSIGALGSSQNLLTLTLPPIVPSSAGKRISVGTVVNFKIASCGCNVVQFLAQPSGNDSVDTQAPGLLGWYIDVTGNQFDLESDGVSRWRSTSGFSLMLTGWTAPDVFSGVFPVFPLNF